MSWQFGRSVVLRLCADACRTGISSFDVSLEKQEVLVKGAIPYDELLEKIKKTGKEVGGPFSVFRIVLGCSQWVVIYAGSLRRDFGVERVDGLEEHVPV